MWITVVKFIQDMIRQRRLTSILNYNPTTALCLFFFFVKSVVVCIFIFHLKYSTPFLPKVQMNAQCQTASAQHGAHYNTLILIHISRRGSVTRPTVLLTESYKLVILVFRFLSTFIVLQCFCSYAHIG